MMQSTKPEVVEILDVLFLQVSDFGTELTYLGRVHRGSGAPGLAPTKFCFCDGGLLCTCTHV